jgi:hypothetical protein
MIASLLMRESVPLIAAGVLIGSAGALVAGRLTKNLLFDTGAADPVIYGAAIVLLLAIAFVAAYARLVEQHGVAYPDRCVRRQSPARERNTV